MYPLRAAFRLADIPRKAAIFEKLSSHLFTSLSLKTLYAKGLSASTVFFYFTLCFLPLLSIHTIGRENVSDAPRTAVMIAGFMRSG